MHCFDGGENAKWFAALNLSVFLLVRSSLCVLCALCVSVVKTSLATGHDRIQNGHHRETTMTYGHENELFVLCAYFVALCLCGEGVCARSSPVVSRNLTTKGTKRTKNSQRQHFLMKISLSISIFILHV